jgi:hypothetical protein
MGKCKLGQAAFYAGRRRGDVFVSHTNIGPFVTVGDEHALGIINFAGIADFIKVGGQQVLERSADIGDHVGIHDEDVIRLAACAAQYVSAILAEVNPTDAMQFARDAGERAKDLKRGGVAGTCVADDPIIDAAAHGFESAADDAPLVANNHAEAEGGGHDQMSFTRRMDAALVLRKETAGGIVTVRVTLLKLTTYISSWFFGEELQ